MLNKIGPGVLVAAAFIGPGTITACTLAGVEFGYTLLWAMGLSIVATIVLQEMASRLGIVTQRGLADAIKNEIIFPPARTLFMAIILGAIVVGNAAYEGGNIGGGTLGLEALFGPEYLVYYPYIVGVFAFALLYIGNYRTMEKVFIGLVLIMSLSFLITAVIVGPNMGNILKGLLVPTVPADSILMVMALVGTTVVPYNLFLHAALVSEKWKSESDLISARRDTVVSIILGGVVSMAIVVAAAAIPGGRVENVMDLAKGLAPLYGSMARYFIGIGLFAAGITSAITAPLAAAYVANSCFGWKAGMKDKRFRSVWILILVLGVFSMSLGIRPIEIIRFAQIANGILLPVIGVFLLWAANRPSIMGKHRNTITQNIIGLLIVALALVLGAKSILRVVGLF